MGYMLGESPSPRGLFASALTCTNRIGEFSVTPWQNSGYRIKGEQTLAM